MNLRKLAPRYVSPFEIELVVNPVMVRLKLPALMKVRLTFYISQIQPVNKSELEPQTNDPPQARIIDGEEAFPIRKMLDMFCCGRGWQYLVDWQGYLPEERWWIL